MPSLVVKLIATRPALSTLALLPTPYINSHSTFDLSSCVSSLQLSRAILRVSELPLGFRRTGKHILNVQAAIRSPCCKKWFDVRAYLTGVHKHLRSTQLTLVLV